ncbi:MAG: dolichyl-phosphate beta-glucosyltransferase [Gemmatimonadales bacterium]
MTDRPRRAFSLLTNVVPAYNEVARIEATLEDIRAYFSRKPYDVEVIVAADGDDGTREVVRTLAASYPRLMVIGGSERRGKGYAIRQAVRVARGDVIGFVDADNKTPINEFDKFEPHLAQGSEVVIGSRGLPESKVERPQPWFRRIGSKGFGLFMHFVVGLSDIADTQCGFKFFQRDVALDLFNRQRVDSYMFDVEILYLATRSGYQIVQVPVRWSDDGDSRLQLVLGNLQHAMDIFRIRFGRYPAKAADGTAANSGVRS